MKIPSNNFYEHADIVKWISLKIYIVYQQVTHHFKGNKWTGASLALKLTATAF